MAELGQTNDPKALVPGDVGTVADTMWQLRTYGDELHEAGDGLSAIDTTGGWSGAAADAFHKVFHGQPGKWTEAGDCFHDAANALDQYDNTLQWAQQKASDAVQLWNEGQAATTQAKTAHAQAVAHAQQENEAAAAAGEPTTPVNIPFVDPGEAKRQAAQQMLQLARDQLKKAGDTATAAVGKARDKAPPKPGFWSQLGSDITGMAESAFHGLEDVGATMVNDVASFGDAVVNHPGDVLSAIGGAGLTALSSAGDAGGFALDATGIGAIAGVPLNAVSTAGVVAGSGIIAAAGADLMHHAMTDDEVSPMKVESSGGGGSDEPGPTKTDRLKEHLTDRDLDAARRELDGEVVATKSDGTPWDHVDEVRNTQRGLVNRIGQIKRQLSDSRISDADRAGLNDELSQASKLLDYSEQFVPRN